MNYEQKYEQKYREALGWMRSLYDGLHGATKEDAEHYFPELKESEDERVKKRILLSLEKDLMATKNSGCSTKDLEDCITWLEKQGETFNADITNRSDEILHAISTGLTDVGIELGWSDFGGIPIEEIQDWLEKQGEKKHFSNFKAKDLYVFKAKDWYVSKVDGKIHNMTYNPTDEVEPKFKVGDWITDGHLICKVLSVTGKSYELHLYNDDYCHFETDVQSVDKRYHLWTIADAKDGDVLASEDKDKIFLYNGKLDLRGRACAYCGIYKTYDGLRFAKCTVGNYFTYKEPYPTTKEQRDTLFAKMADAGYEWDANKKELKKVEPKNPIVNVPSRELILSIWDLGNEWKELTNGSISTEYGTQLEYIQKHWQESSYYDNIGDNIPTLTDKDYDKLFINCKREKIEI